MVGAIALGLPIYLTHAPLTIRQIYDLAGALCAEGDIRLVIVDYLQLIPADADIRERRLQVEAINAGENISLQWESGEEQVAVRVHGRTLRLPGLSKESSQPSGGNAPQRLRSCRSPGVQA